MCKPSRFLAAWVAVGLCASALAGQTAVDVEPVWAGHPVGFALLTHPPHQFAAYYDAERRMSIAQRRLNEKRWTITKLPTSVKWDSHNYITMTIDRKGYLHVAGNMHCVKMIYFRSEKPMDAGTLKRVDHMVGPEREQRVTYPVFMTGPKGDLIFRYRDGGSGNGDDIYNVYNESNRTWRRLIDQPLTGGEGKMNAYCTRPTLGPDGWYHMVWVWRDTPDCATNHDLSYARSRDLVNWERADGRKLTLPITIGQGCAVDPVPVKAGLLNGGHQLNFDSRRRPIIVYHKHDRDGWLQLYAARLENRRWRITKLTDWKGYRWEFSGGGSIERDLYFGALRDAGPGLLKVNWNRGGKRGTTVLNEATLKPVPPGAIRKALLPVESKSVQRIQLEKPDFPGLQQQSASDLGDSGDPNVSYHMVWWTQKRNRDRPIPGPIPPPVMLRVIKTMR